MACFSSLCTCVHHPNLPDPAKQFPTGVASARCVLQLRPRPENRGTVRALRHFDEFYASVFGDAWPSVRLALLCPNKPCAVLNSFLDERGAREVHRRLQDTGALSLRNLCERRAAAAAKAAGNEHGGNEELSSRWGHVLHTQLQTVAILHLPVPDSPRAVRALPSLRRSLRNTPENRAPDRVPGSPGTIRD